LLEKADAFIQAHEAYLDNVNSTLNFLESYVVEHFRDEEALQVSSNYSKYHEHKRMHGSFIKDFAKLKNRIDENGVSPDNMRYFKDILVKWIIDHIDGSDVEFAAYYNSNSR
jgi:hemerythrin